MNHRVSVEKLSESLKFAEQGNRCAQYNFGFWTNSVEWITKAAEQNHASAQHYLYLHFSRFDKKPGKAIYWFKRKSNVNKVSFESIEKCQKACYQIILIRKHRQIMLSWIPKDVVLMIAKILLSTWEEPCWLVKYERFRKRIKNAGV